MRRNRGLGSSVGTFTHIEYHPGYMRDAVRASKRIVDTRQIKRLRKEEHERMLRERFPEFFCTVCGQKCPNEGGSSSAEISRKLRCFACVSTESYPITGKHCRICGNFFLKEECVSRNGSHVTSWHSWCRCDGCHLKCTQILDEIRKLVKEKIK